MAIVKANYTLSSGGIVVLKRTFQNSLSYNIQYTIEYCCLAQFRHKYVPYFKYGSDPIDGLPSEISNLKGTFSTENIYAIETEDASGFFANTPTLESVEIQTANGLTFFKATYNQYRSTYTTVTSTEQRSFSASATGTGTSGTKNPYNQGDQTYLEQQQTTTLAFDYMSTTVTVESRNGYYGAGTGSVGNPFNQRITNSNSNVGSVSVPYSASYIDSKSSETSTSGETIYRTSSTGIYTTSLYGT